MNIDSKTKHLVESGVKQIVFPGYCKKVVRKINGSGLVSSSRPVNAIAYECTGIPKLVSSGSLVSSSTRVNTTTKNGF